MKKQAILALTLSAVCGASLFTGCAKQSSRFAKEYVESVLEVSYRGDLDSYMKKTSSTEEDAQSVYDDTVAYYVSYLMYNCDVDSDYISEEINEQYTELAKDILKQAKCEVTKSENGKESSYITIQIQPLDIAAQAQDSIDACIDAFNDQIGGYTEEELNEMSDEEYGAIENSYAEDVLEALQECAKSPQYRDSVDVVIEIVKDEDGLYGCANDSDWDKVDNQIMGID